MSCFAVEFYNLGGLGADVSIATPQQRASSQESKLPHRCLGSSEPRSLWYAFLICANILTGGCISTSCLLQTKTE
jgi:hypothetical protein